MRVTRARISLAISHTGVGPVLKECVRCLKHEVIRIIGVRKLVETPIRKVLVAEKGLAVLPTVAGAQRYLESKPGD